METDRYLNKSVPILVPQYNKAAYENFQSLHNVPGMNHVENEILRHKYGVALVMAGCTAAGGPAGAGACSAYFAGLAGGDANDILRTGLKAYVIADLSSGLNGVIGDTFDPGFNNFVAHAVLGGAESIAQGGSFEDGLVNGGLAGLYENYGGGVRDFAGRYGAVGVGIVSSKLTGDDPTVAIMTSLMSFMYNLEGHKSETSHHNRWVILGFIDVDFSYGLPTLEWSDATRPPKETVKEAIAIKPGAYMNAKGDVGASVGNSAAGAEVKANLGNAIFNNFSNGSGMGARANPANSTTMKAIEEMDNAK